MKIAHNTVKNKLEILVEKCMSSQYIYIQNGKFKYNSIVEDIMILLN